MPPERKRPAQGEALIYPGKADRYRLYSESEKRATLEASPAATARLSTHRWGPKALLGLLPERGRMIAPRAKRGRLGRNVLALVAKPRRHAIGGAA